MCAKNGTRVLVVDDFTDHVRSLEMFLTLQGYEVRVSDRPAEAFDLVCAWQPQIALIELHMRGLDGYQFARCLECALQRHIPLIALAATYFPGQRDRWREEGFDYFMLKPLDLLRLQSILKEAPRIGPTVMPPKRSLRVTRCPLLLLN